MQFPESWLREFCNPPIDTAELADLLTMAGMEVEEMRTVAPAFTHVVVGEVLAVERHPNADKLNVCLVNVGGSTPLSIVCGAPNVRPGIKVPCALVGAELPPSGDDEKSFQIKLGMLRGVESQGMLCSARELKLSEDHGGLLILADSALVGQNVREHLSLDDTLFTLKLTPNLGHCLSVYGIAREVSALTGTPLREPSIASVTPTHADTLPVQVQAADLCGRFSGRIVRNVNPKAATPGWMVDRLARCGQRSVTALVDISNYVMFEFGRPSHIFDLNKIHGGLHVRWGRAGESLKLLNGNTIEVDAQVGVIADHESVESLAGIMGGDATAVSDETQHVFVEAAFWWPEAVAGRSRRFGFTTDAGHRFERGVDPALTVEHLERITQLIVDVCGGEPGPMLDQVLAMPERMPVVMRVQRAAKVIGMPVTQAQCAAVFGRLGLQFTEAPGVLTVTPPSWRFDLRIEEDLIEEVIRVLGFKTLPDTRPNAPLIARVRSEATRSAHTVRQAMAALDYFETINYSFVEERWERELAGNVDPIRVLNPIASPLSVMRSSMLGGLVQALRYNLARKALRVRLFEVGRVFMRDAQVRDGPLSVAGVNQPMRLAGVAYGSVDSPQWGVKDRAVDFFDVRGDVEVLFAPTPVSFVRADHPALHPGRCARIEVAGHAVGFIGELHPKWRQGYDLPSAPMLFEIELQAVLQHDVPVMTAISRQQSVWRDIAVITKEGVTHASLIQAIHATPTTLVRSARLFDIYKPAVPTGDIAAGERSMAVRLELQDEVAALTDERIDAVVAQVLDSLAQRLGARLRG
jgi:phenylalanyl-tRNA synthetase beta chain